MASADSSDGRARVTGIEGLRAIAATSILVYHVWLYGAADGRSVDLGAATKGFDNLRAGVTLFFVLSGFLLFRPYVQSAWRTSGSPSLGNYLRNRTLRILPAYWVVLLVVAAVLEPELLRAPKQLAANALLLQNYVPSYIYGAGIVPAWSLAIEVVFYLAVPVLGGLAIRAARRGGMSPLAASLLPVAVMVAIGFAAKAGAHFLAGDTDRVWQLTFLAHADWFAAGMAVAALRVRWERCGGTLPRIWRPLAALVAAALGAVAAGLYYPGKLSYLEYQTPIAVSCALVLCLVVFPSGRSRVLRLLESRVMVGAGLASYSLFLWHDPLLRAFRDAGWTFDGRGGFVVNLLIVGTVSGVASAVTYRTVEKPALGLKRRWQTPAPAPREAAERTTDVPVAAPASSAP